MTNLAFKGISWFPGRILQWISPYGTYVSASVAAGPPITGATAAALPGSASAALLAGAQTVTTPGAASESRRPDAASTAARAHGLKAALLPAFHEKPEEPVVIGGKDETAAQEQGGGIAATRSGSAAAATSGGTATASATASAQAIAVARQMPAYEKTGSAAIDKALEKLAAQKDRRALTPGTETKEPGKDQRGKEESPEQSSAPPEPEDPA
jgi:hypothetical protein